MQDLAARWSSAPRSGDDPFRRLGEALTSMERQLDARVRQADAEKSQLEAVLAGMVEGVVVLSRDGAIQLANERAARLFGAADSQAMGGTAILSWSRDPDLQKLVQQVLGNPGAAPQGAEITLGHGGGEETLQVTASAVPRALSGQPLAILVFHDVTQLKRLEAARRDFVANVSHEIRTPLTAIRGYAETLRSGALDDRQRAQQFLGVIERHSERLSRLTDDLLALSDLELGRVALRKTRMSVESAVDTAIDVVRDKAERGQIELEKQMAPALPPLVADHDRVVQVLVNLIDNAVKYSPPGATVTVSAALQAEAIELDVRDTGTGIPSQDLPRLTERFYRVDKARSRELGGTGLGLAIVKHIVQAHGGALRIDSTLGKGTTVRVQLPLGE